jgi:hypothetical protein
MTYVFDIDGTICSLTSGDYKEAEPFEERIEKINELYDAGHTIHFNTARGMGRSNNAVHFVERVFRKITEEQLEQWGVKYHKLFLGKPSGDIYIDDKGAKDVEFFTD